MTVAMPPSVVECGYRCMYERRSAYNRAGNGGAIYMLSGDLSAQLSTAASLPSVSFTGCQFSPLSEGGFEFSSGPQVCAV